MKQWWGEVYTASSCFNRYLFPYKLLVGYIQKLYTFMAVTLLDPGTMELKIPEFNGDEVRLRIIFKLE